MSFRTYRGEERLLGVRVQFHADETGWFWMVLRESITLEPKVRFGSRLAARLSVMSCIFAYAVQEECSAVTIPMPAPSDDEAPRVPSRPPSDPPQGCGG